MTITCPIVGAYYRPPAKAILDWLPVGAKLILRAELDNAYDENAIMVIVPSASIPSPMPAGMVEALGNFGFSESDFASPDGETHCGYIPREQAAELRAYGFPPTQDIPALFSVSTNGAPRVRFEEVWRN